MKKTPITLSLLATLFIAATANGATRQWNGNSGTDNNWGTDSNWGTAAPLSTDNVSFRGKTGGAQDATAQLFSGKTVGDLTMGGVGTTSTKGTPTLTINTGGSLAVTDDTHIGYSLVNDSSAATAKFAINSGTNTFADVFNIANAAGTSAYATSGEVTVSGADTTVTLAGVGKIATRGGSATGATTGTLTLNGGNFNSTKTGVAFTVGDYGNGTLTLNGGNASFVGSMKVADKAGSTGLIQLLEGNLDVTTITFGAGDKSMILGEGYLTMILDKTNLIDGWIAANIVSAVGGMTDDSIFSSVYTSGLTEVALDGFTVKYGYDGSGETAMWVAIPESRAYSMIAGITGLVFVMVRRRR
jgi:hypothetical protein